MQEDKKTKENRMDKLSTDWNDRLENSSYDLEDCWISASLAGRLSLAREILHFEYLPR